MRKHLLTSLAILASVPSLPAAVVLTLNPTTISGAPGQAVGWGFTLTSDPQYFVSVSSAFIETETNPALGFFSDWISLAGGPVNSVFPPGAPDWIQTYNAALGTGFGEYWIDGGAVPGDTNDGAFLFIYQRFSGDPNSCGSCFVDTQFSSASFGVNVVAPESSPVPEPKWTGLLGLAVLVIYYNRRGLIPSVRATAAGHFGPLLLSVPFSRIVRRPAAWSLKCR